MMILFLTIFFMLLVELSEFSGVFLYLVMFIYLLFNFDLAGMYIIKGDLFGMLGLDYISFYMILLLLWVISLVLILFYSWFLFFLVILLMFSMLIMFSSMDLLCLFISFEFVMLPMFLIILFFGSWKERYGAGLYMFIYTMVSSLPMLIVFLIFMQDSGSSSIDYFLFNLFDFNSWLQIAIMLLFLVKVPMILVHIWLPKAHVEAPVFGSMILASIMLKMGGYGLIRCLDFMELAVGVSDFFFCLCLWGVLVISYMCLYQVDLKILVAYSSVVHMGVMLMGFFSGSELGYVGGFLMMLSHGICSSGMFYLVNEIYEITGSRLLMLNKGCMTVMPILIWLWFIMLICNLGIPPCFGILGELLLMSGCLMYTFFCFIMFFFIVFFIACFVINMYSLLVVGLFMFSLVNVKLSTYYGSFIHLIPLNFFIFFCQVFL